jgi:hypothetical protein
MLVGIVNGIIDEGVLPLVHELSTCLIEDSSFHFLISGGKVDCFAGGAIAALP